LKTRALRIQLSKSELPFTSIENLEIENLNSGELLIETEYSSLNYKDALAVTGKGKILKKFPLTPGIDVSGTVFSSKDPNFKPGEKVFIIGSGLGESFDGGYSQFVKTNASIVMPIPKGFTTRETMILGTAGFTAGLCLYRMLANGQTPEMGPILITGASGGVGMSGIQVFSKMGFQVHAVSSKLENYKILENMGASKVIDPNLLNLGSRPLESAAWGGAVDNLGGEFLSKIISHIHIGGNVCSVGLASSFNFNSTVMPFILRGVSLLGISSTNCPIPLKKKIWTLLANEWKPNNLQNLCTNEISLDQIIDYSHRLIDRKIYGRTLVNLKKSI
jgi:acrylyl-CoA reductase (NADPH)